MIDLFGIPLASYNTHLVYFGPDTTPTQEGLDVMALPSCKAAIFVDRACTEHWIVRDPEGQFWIVPSVENAWAIPPALRYYGRNRLFERFQGTTGLCSAYRSNRPFGNW